MKPMAVAVLFTLFAFGINALAESRWDGSYTRKCHMVMDGGQQLCAVSDGGPYVKAVCGKDTAIGATVRQADAGPSNVCYLADGGMACDIVRFTLGEKFYSQLTPGQNAIAAYGDGGSDNCDVFEGK